nr:MAG TPA: hypothetical protein [Caudoviricetes sp.]
MANVVKISLTYKKLHDNFQIYRFIFVLRAFISLCV